MRLNKNMEYENKKLIVQSLLNVEKAYPTKENASEDIFKSWITYLNRVIPIEAYDLDHKFIANFQEKVLDICMKENLDIWAKIMYIRQLILDHAKEILNM